MIPRRAIIARLYNAKTTQKRLGYQRLAHASGLSLKDALRRSAAPLNTSDHFVRRSMCRRKLGIYNTSSTCLLLGYIRDLALHNRRRLLVILHRRRPFQQWRQFSRCPRSINVVPPEIEFWSHLDGSCWARAKSTKASESFQHRDTSWAALPPPKRTMMTRMQ